MKYVLLAYADERLLETMPASERAAFASACQANDDALRQNGHLLAAEGLAGSCAAMTVRVQNGRLEVDDGPVTRIHEQIIGMFTIHARDLNEAIQVAATMPQVRAGPIEVRPLAEQGRP
jgi:hypothetical protein